MDGKNISVLIASPRNKKKGNFLVMFLLIKLRVANTKQNKKSWFSQPGPTLTASVGSPGLAGLP
jgi:hypothetical protein